jgi:hypothetical protein
MLLNTSLPHYRDFLLGLLSYKTIYISKLPTIFKKTIMLHDRILKLKQEISQLSTNPVLNVFNLDECKLLDDEYTNDTFVKEKVDSTLNLLKDLNVDFNPKYKSAYEEYNEGVIYLKIKSKYSNTNRIPEKSSPTPDFHVIDEGNYPFDINIELKSLSFLDGNLNYKNAQESGLEAQIRTEEQLKNGQRIAFSETIISPFLKNNKIPTTRELIEIYIDKVNNNIKMGQFEERDTILFVDIKQLLLGSLWNHSAVAFYQEKLTKSIVSGILWNTAFGTENNLILKPIEFEGKNNIDSVLTRNGILCDYDYVKAIVFITYENFEQRKFIGFIRQSDFDTPIMNFISGFCDFYNDDYNTEAWRVLNDR